VTKFPSKLVLPSCVSASVWERVPLAKRRLASLGPLDVGRAAMGDAVVIVAAELRAQKVPEDVALVVCLAIPFETDSTPAGKVRKSVGDWVRWAYNPPDGKPILTGCPGAARHTGIAAPTGRLRGRFSGYCDAECKRTCPIRSATLTPALVLVGSDYSPILGSTLWTSRMGLGATGKAVWERVAAMAVAADSENVLASQRFLTIKMDGQFPNRTIGNALTNLETAGLVTMKNPRTGERTIHVRGAKWVADAERARGTRAGATANIHTASRESVDYMLYLNQWEDEEELLAGCGPADESDEAV
jgi:hypothetical protein